MGTKQPGAWAGQETRKCYSQSRLLPSPDPTPSSCPNLSNGNLRTQKGKDQPKAASWVSDEAKAQQQGSWSEGAL